MVYRITGYGETVDFPTLKAALKAVHACGGDFVKVKLTVRGGTRIVNERGEKVGEVVEEVQ